MGRNDWTQLRKQNNPLHEKKYDNKENGTNRFVLGPPFLFFCGGGGRGRQSRRYSEWTDECFADEVTPSVL